MFLIIYFICMLFCGVPIFLQEVAIGQYLGAGGMTMIAKICPILKGKNTSIQIMPKNDWIYYPPAHFYFLKYYQFTHSAFHLQALE